MSSIGTVLSWNLEDGWGVIESADTPGGCWFHVSAWLARGAEPQVGTPVAFDPEAGRQDGYDFRALGVWPADSSPVSREVNEGSTAYASFGWVTITGPDGEEIVEPL
ncbi:MAG TPA: hypothetical protein VJ872_03090 [Nocardioides sp.]|nr:hypothetical protein [Nocardioides sp.]